MSRLLLRTLPVVVAALALSACGDDEPTTPTNPTSPVTVTETFNGTVTRNGAQMHTFSTQASGQVSATLKFLVPDNSVRMGFALGTFNGTNCQLIIPRTDATEGTTIIGAVSALGTLCVYIHDVGNLTQSTDYEIEVIHP
jgi:hypothetical protein